jgi:sugar/nucleoside kinase (ribokinase family)
MPPAPPPHDLLVAGALTVDRFTDDRTAPGGSVVHAGTAAANGGALLATVTVCGDEPAAHDGLRRLGGFGPLTRQASPSSVGYRHEESDGQRVLVYESGCDPLSPETMRQAPAARVALLAPIADELPAAAIDALRGAIAPERTVLLIQGWLRELRLGQPVRPKALADLAPETRAAFAAADALVVSTEDLAETPGDPFGQAALLRAAVGDAPIVVVTLGAEGFLLDDPAEPRIVASVPRRVIDDVPNVGAGDTFGAALAVALGAGRAPLVAANQAAEAVIAMLEARRG